MLLPLFSFYIYIPFSNLGPFSNLVNFRIGGQSQRTDHNGFAIPSAPTGKGRFGSQNSLPASGSHGSLSDLSQTDSNPDLNGNARKLSIQSTPDQTPRRGSASDKYACRLSLVSVTVRLLLPRSLKENWPIRLQDENNEFQPKPIEPITSRRKTAVKTQNFGIGHF